MKTAVSIPDSLFHAADTLAGRLGLSRSELYARAVKQFIADHRDDGVTEALNRTYEGEDSRLDPVIQALQAASLEDDPW